MRSQVNLQRVSLVCLSFCEELPDNRMLESNGQDTVIEAVVIEDVGEAGCYEAAEAIIANSPGGVFAR